LRLIEVAVAVLSRIGGMDQQMHLARAGRSLDALRPVDELSRTRLHPEAVESGLPKRLFDALAKVGGHPDVVGFEGALKSALELALGVGRVELATGHPDPRAAAGRP